MRIVRRGFRLSDCRIRTASIATATPAPLSVAPVPACHESMWPPSMTTSSFKITAGDFGDRVVAHQIRVLKFHCQIDGHLHFSPPQHADDAIVVFDREHQLDGHRPSLLVIGLDQRRRAGRKRTVGDWLRHGGRLHKNCSAVASATGVNQHRSALRSERIDTPSWPEHALPALSALFARAARGRGAGASAKVNNSFSFRRVPSGSKRAFTSRTLPVKTILSLSFPLKRSRSARSFAST